MIAILHSGQETLKELGRARRDEGNSVCCTHTHTHGTAWNEPLTQFQPNVQGSAKRNANVAKQDPGRAKQKS